jgi:putative flippase GtrA
MTWQFLKFVFFGGVNTIVGLSVIFMAIHLLAAGPLAANAAGYLAGFLLSFVLNGWVTFNRDSLPLPMFGRFVAVYLAAYLANVAAMWLSLPYGKYLAQITGMAVYTFIGFFGCRLFVFAAA